MKMNKYFPHADAEGMADIQRTFDEMSLIDDTFFRIVMRDNPKAAEAIVRIVLDMPDVEIESVQVQNEIRFPRRRGVCFDLKAKKPDGTLFDIEMQKEGEGNLPRRSRFYLSAMTVDAMEPKQDFDQLPDAYVIFICKRDPFEKGKPVYSFLRREEDGSILGDGGDIVFFNCSYKGKDVYGRLANDLTIPNFAQIADPVLMDTVKSGKIGERRNEIMTGLSKELYEKGEARGRKAGEKAARETCIIAMLKDGHNSPEDIVRILGVPLEDVLALKKREGI